MYLNLFITALCDFRGGTSAPIVSLTQHESPLRDRQRLQFQQIRCFVQSLAYHFEEKALEPILGCVAPPLWNLLSEQLLFNIDLCPIDLYGKLPL